MLACAATIACWLASFGLCYLVSLRQLGNNQYLLDYRASHFLPLPPTGQGDLLWLADHFFTFLAYPGGLGGTEIKIGGIAAAFCLIGLAAMARERLAGGDRASRAGRAGPHGVGAAQVSFRRAAAPLPGPPHAPGRGAARSSSHRRFVRSSHLRPCFSPGSWSWLPTIETYQNFRHPPRSEELAPLLNTVREEWQPGDKVYVYYGATPAFTYYTRDNPFPPGVVLGREHRGQRTPYRDELVQLAGSGRVWIIFSHVYQSEDSLIRAYAEGFGVCRKTLHAPGAAAYLFDFHHRN